MITERAYGKLNLTLDVLGKREDGYHDLRMVMCSVSLCDDVSIELQTGRRSCRVEGAADAAPIPENEKNLAYRAAAAYFDAAGIDGGFAISIVKRIPAQAGMAGGSSDAAAVLRALNRRFGAFSEEQLRALGLTLGSDVPYCLFGGVALAEGRGERLTRLPALPAGLHFVLVRPDFSVSTPALFGALDAYRARNSGEAQRNEEDSSVASLPRNDKRGRNDKTAALCAALEAGDANGIGAALHNDFAAVLAETQPVVEDCKRTLLQLGALGAELTGTGSVIYGLFDDPDAAARAARTVQNDHAWFAGVTTAHTLS